MDRQLLVDALRDFLARYQTARYRGLALSSDGELNTQVTMEVLCELLPTWQRWEKPGHNAPTIPCHRKDFIDQAISQPGRDSLLILSPENWMYDWSDAEKETFWISLAEMYGRHSVITVSLDSHMTQHLLSITFKSFSLPHCPVQVWISKHQPWA